MKKIITGLITLILLAGVPTFAVDARPERALIAIPSGGKQVYLGWRSLGTDPADVAFNVYRSTEGGPAVRLNASPIRNSTDFVDATASIASSNVWWVKPVIAGRESDAGANMVSLKSRSAALSYLTIPLESNYVFSKVGIADLDGDGKLDFVIKEPQQVTDPGVWKPSEHSFKVEAYKSDGKFLWRSDLGRNIEQGVRWSPMIVADFDGDGKAEVALKTAPMDVDYRGANGRVLAGPEYLSVWDGMTGREITKVDWPARGSIEDWGDKVGNRASRHLIGMAKLDGKRTSLLALRGTYTKMLVDAYNLSGGRLEKVWGWNGDDESPQVRGQGMHGMHAADLDGDGREEIITSVPGELRIYTTTIPSTRRHVWLMEDPIYHNDVSLVAMGYLYPPQLAKPMTAETKP